MPQENSLTDAMTDVEPIEITNQKPTKKKPGPKRKRRRKKAADRWDSQRQRYWIYLNKNTKAQADATVVEGGSPHDYLSGTINQMLENWLAGHYDETHQKLGWPERPQID